MFCFLFFFFNWRLFVQNDGGNAHGVQPNKKSGFKNISATLSVIFLWRFNAVVSLKTEKLLKPAFYFYVLKRQVLISGYISKSY